MQGWLAAAAIVTVEQLGWMSGHWSGASSGVRMEEHWTSPAAGLMVGMHRDVAPSKKPAFEFLRIEQRESGPVYLAMPGGRPATEFPLKSLSGGQAIFENLNHDFPQRILYWRDGESLCARAEGTLNGNTVGEEWCWGKAPLK
jgi:hypothetical protein